MVGFLRWLRSIAVGTLNGIVKFALFLVIVFLGLSVIGLIRGDGLPSNMVLALDLRRPLADSLPDTFTLGGKPVTVMDIVLGLDNAEHDSRVKGVVIRLGDANLPIAQAEEIGAALKRFKKSGKFVIAHAQGFDAPGLGDYLAASAADEIWMQPKSVFAAAGEGGGELFLKGFFEKIQAEPQIAKRADYKSAADMFMEKNMTDADREQVTALLQSWYDTATKDAAASRKMTPEALHAVFEKSPQFTDDAKKAGLVDKVGYDDDAMQAALERAGKGAKSTSMAEFVRTKEEMRQSGDGAHVALIEAAGEIVEGTSGGDAVMAGDDIARAVRDAAKDKDTKAIILRVSSPGGSVTASDQILDAVKKAQAKGIPVVVSMGTLAASGGYYIATSADRIVAEPGTITGSIGVLTGKISFGKTLQLAGIGTDQVGIGHNALMSSSLTPYTDEQWAALNAQADLIYDDFKQKVSKGRKIPMDKVQEIARGRVWTGQDASARGLVDDLGNFWTAVDATKKLANIKPDERVVFERYPHQKSFFETLDDVFGDDSATSRALQGFVTIMNSPVVQAVAGASAEAPRGGVEMRATNLPH